MQGIDRMANKTLCYGSIVCSWTASVARRFIFTLFFLGLGCSLASAQSEIGPQRLAPGDRVHVAVFGQSELSGEFPVEGSGALVLPLIGTVAVQDLSLDQAEKQISAKLKGHLQNPIVSLRLTESRPIYILGDVRNPGSYPFRNGSTVLSMVASAGGFGLKETAVTGSRSEFLLAEERYKLLQTNQRALLIRLARLEAQQNDALDLNMPDEPRLSGNPQEVARILKQERHILSERRAGHEQTLQLLRAQKPRLEAEIAATNAQAVAEKQQLQLLQEHIASYSKLLENGLARRYTQIELQREEGRHKGNLARFAADIARLEIGLGEVDLRIQAMENEYQEKISNEIQEVRSRLQELDITMPLARELREARLQQGGAAASMLTSEVRRAIKIVRVRSGKAETTDADATTLLMPGDIIDVQRAELPDSASLTMDKGL